MMQKRRINTSANKKSSNSGLPLTDSDVQNIRTTTTEQRRFRIRTKKSSRNSFPCAGYSLILFAVTIIASIGLIVKGSSGGTDVPSRRRAKHKEKIVHDVVSYDGNELKLPLSLFQSLQYALEHSKLVGLYFAAAWCPICATASDQIDKYLGDSLLQPPSKSKGTGTNLPPLQQAPLSIVYISSDRNRAEYEEYLERYHHRWLSVPFADDSNDDVAMDRRHSAPLSKERTALKKHFSACSKPEVPSLGIHRKFEIPTLIIIDSESHGIITTSGREDLEQYKEEALDHWLDLQLQVRVMEDKYSNSENQLDSSVATTGDGSLASQHGRRLHAHPHTHAEAYSALFS